jgi:hypothetical protein
MNHLDYLNSGNMANARFRTKSGFPLEATGVLPTKPIQTASAATPQAAPVSKPRLGFPGIPAAVDPPVKQPAAPFTPLQTEPDLRQRPASRAPGPERARPARRTRPSHKEQAMRASNALQTQLIGSVLLVSIALAFSAIWWIEGGRTIPAMAGIFSESAPIFSTGKAAGKASSSIQASNTAAVESRPENTEDTAVSQQAAATATILQTEPATPNPAQAVSEQAVNTDQQTLGATTARSASRPMASKKNAKPEPIGLPKKRMVTARKKERVDEIGRLQTQAFSETKRDRLESGGTGAEKSPPDYRFDQQSMKRNSYDAKRADKHAGSLRNAFNECQRNANFIQREQCKWRVCSGKWGKNGCPSYKREDPTSY